MDEERRSTNVRLPRSLLDELKAVARLERRSVAATIEIAVERYTKQVAQRKGNDGEKI